MNDSTCTESLNHRTKVGMQRRERTRQRILEAALRVFARHGIDAPVIDDFIAEAGISRGTFYNYFSTTEELLQATAGWLSDGYVESIAGEISGLSDPLLRVTAGIRIWLRKACQDLPWAAFVARVDFIRDLPLETLRSDLQHGLQSGVFRFPDERVALELIAGTLIMAMHSIVRGHTDEHYTEQTIHMILQGLGVEPTLVIRALASPLPAI